MTKLSYLAVVLIAALGVTACGSSDSDSSGSTPTTPVVNQAPIISLAKAGSVQEKGTMTISAKVTDDGSISDYKWQLVAGQLAFTGADTSEISFTAPSVSSDQDYTFRLTATDDKGESSTADIVVTVKQRLFSLTLNGLITDAPINNANITVKVGEQEQVFTAEHDGRYTASIQVDDDNTDGFVSVIGQGVGAQKVARLKSLLGTFSGLQQSAGDDGILDKSENFNVNVTNITTAKSALIEQVTQGQAITSDADFKELAEDIDVDKMMKIATAIKVAIDKSQGDAQLSLPKGVADTLALVNDLDQAEQYVAKVAGRPEYDQAEQEIAKDNELVDTNLVSVDSGYYFLPFGYQDKDAPILKFDKANNKGQYFLGDVTAPFSWQADNSSITLKFKNFIAKDTEFVDINDDGIEEQIELEETISKITMTQLLANDNSATFQVVINRKVHYPNGELPDPSKTKSEVVVEQAILASASDSFSQLELGGNMMVLPVPKDFFAACPQLCLEADEFILDPSGSGRTVHAKQELNWQLIDDPLHAGSKRLQIVFNSGETLVYTKVKTNPQNDVYALEASKGQEKMAAVLIGDKLNSDNRFNTASLPGIYRYQGNSQLLEEQWFELWPSGQMYSIYTKDKNGDKVLSEQEVHIIRGGWSIGQYGTAKGIAYISEWFNDSTNEPCFANQAGCSLRYLHSWKALGKLGETRTVLHDYSSYSDGGFKADTKAIDIRKVTKLAERPLQALLPDMPGLTQLGPKLVPGLLSAAYFHNKPMYTAYINDIIDGKPDVQGPDIITLGHNGNYSLIENTNGESTTYQGTYYVLADNSIRTREGLDGASLALTNQFKDGEHTVTMLLNSGGDKEGDEGHIALLYDNEAGVKAYAERLATQSPAMSMAKWENKALAFIRPDYEDNLAGLVYAKFEDGHFNAYKDARFSEVIERDKYILNADGSISSGDLTMFISAGDDNTVEMVGIDDGYDGKVVDINFAMTDIAKAEGIVASLNQLIVDDRDNK